jgi:predicted DNA-binding transcriptional regulator YafY
MNHYNVVTRLLEILRLVRAGDYPSSNHMAAATGVGWRTIQRDLDFLRQLRVWQRFRSEFSTSLI